MAPSSSIAGRNLVSIQQCNDWHDFKARWRGNLSAAVGSDRLYGRFIFRGQSCSSWKLISSFDRKYANLRGRERAERYDALLLSFAKNLAAFADRDAGVLLGRKLPDLDGDMSEIEVLAQHHGLPTRLLDWSLSIYVAAFFAFSRIDQCTTDLVSIWALNSRFIEDEIDQDHLQIHDDFYAKNSRQLWQLGVFVRNKTQIFDLEDIFAKPDDFVTNAALKGAPALFRFDIPKSEFETAVDDLEMMRINSISLFPGIEGVVRWLDKAT